MNLRIVTLYNKNNNQNEIKQTYPNILLQIKQKDFKKMI